MAKKNNVKCINCGREISSVKAAKSDGWIVQDDGTIYCCCVCISEHSKKSKRKK